MSAYKNIGEEICKVAFSELTPVVNQDQLKNIGTLRALLSVQNDANLQAEVIRTAGRFSGFNLKYFKKNCTPATDECISACDVTSGSNVAKMGSIRVDIDDLNCITSPPIEFSKQDVQAYCGANNEGGIAQFAKAFASQFKDGMVQMYKSLDEKLTAELYNYSLQSFVPVVNGTGTTNTPYNVNLTIPNGSGYTYNTQAFQWIEDAFSRNDVSISDAIWVGGTALVQGKEAFERTLPQNLLLGVDNLLQRDMVVGRMFVDYNVQKLASNAGAVLGILPKIYHLITYSDKLEGFATNDTNLDRLLLSIRAAQESSTTAGYNAVVEDMIKNGFGDTSTTEAITTYAIDETLGRPIVVELHIKKEICGSIIVFAKLRYKLVQLPISDFFCGMEGVNGLIPVNACLPPVPTNCTNPSPTPPSTLLCVAPQNPNECYRFAAGDLLQVSINGTPLPSSVVMQGNITASTTQSALLLLSNLLSSANVAIVNASTGVIQQGGAQVPVIVGGDVISIVSTCSPNPLEYLVSICNPQPVQNRAGNEAEQQIVVAPSNDVKTGKEDKTPKK